MRAGVRKRAADGKYAFTITIPGQPAQRCNDCGMRFWIERRRLEDCPQCHGELRDTIERRQQTTGGFPTRAAAVKAHTDALHALGQGTHVVRQDITLGEYLENEWLPGLAATKLRATTQASYRQHVRYHLAPTPLGAMRLQQLTRERIMAHYARLLQHGRVPRKRKDAGKQKEQPTPRPLSASTVARIHATLHRALRDAVRSHLLPLNPAQDVELPNGKSRERPAWDSANLRNFLESVREDRLGTLWLLYATTGARRGELLGLRHTDVDLKGGRLRIRRALLKVDGEIIEAEPKTERGKREIALPPVIVKALERQRRVQVQERLLRGPRWVDSDFVFTRETGEALDPDAVSREFSATVKRSGLPTITLHGLRHTFATIALNERRQPISQVSARLGHKDVNVTLAIYTHALDEQDEVVALDFADTVVPEGF
jgi:integrase